MAKLLPNEGNAADPEDERDFIRLRKSALSLMGVFVKDYEVPDVGFPSQLWMRLGYGMAEMAGDAWLEKVHPEDRARAAGLTDRLTNEPFFSGYDRYRVRDAEGRWHWIISTGSVDSTFPDGSPRRYLGFDLEITAIHAINEELERAQALAEKRALEAEALRTSGAVIASSLTKEDAISRVVDELRTLLPVETVLVYEERDRTLQLVVDPEQAGSREREMAAIAAARNIFEAGVGQSVLFDAMRNGTPEVFREPARAVAFWLVVPLIAHGEVFGAAVIGRADGHDYDGGEVRLATAVGDYLALALNNARLYEQVRNLARTDQLSQLLTRRALFDEGVALVRAKRVGAGSVIRLACVILDIDHFKQVNDHFGHQTGDEAIRRVADIFREALRGSDIVGRYGGEEFCALLPGLTSTQAQGVAERICCSVRDLQLPAIPDGVTVSLGVSVLELDVTGREMAEGEAFELLDALIGRADVALYRAKNAGRDRVEVIT